jgi:GntR family transcriptional regulator of vanillate catabolism
MGVATMAEALARTQDLATASRVDIVQNILDLITVGNLQPGERTSERALGEALDLGGRASVLREALALLARDGIVEPIPQKGYLIRSFSAEEAAEALELRAASERIVVERLAGLGLTDRLRFAEEISQSMTANAQSDATGVEWERKAAEFAKNDRQLRCELARIGGFITAVYSIAAWSDQLRVFYRSNPFTLPAMQQLAAESHSLLQAIRRTDKAEAVSILDRQTELIEGHIWQPRTVVKPGKTATKIEAGQIDKEPRKHFVARAGRSVSFKSPVAAYGKRASARPRAKAVAASAVAKKK